MNLLHLKSITVQIKVVQHVEATFVALKIVGRRHVTRIDFFCATMLR